MVAEPRIIDEVIPSGPRHALDACALALGAIKGPALLLSSTPSWERALRIQIADQLFTLDDPTRPAAQAWVGAVWLEPRRPTWLAEIGQIERELPRGGLLSIVLSLPLAIVQRTLSRDVLGLLPNGVLRLRGALRAHGFRVERAFGFNTLWAGAMQWLAPRVAPRRPDWSDRLRQARQYSFATQGYALPFAQTGLIEARAGMRP